jgi:hypothetical protein
MTPCLPSPEFIITIIPDSGPPRRSVVTKTIKNSNHYVKATVIINDDHEVLDDLMSRESFSIDF